MKVLAPALAAALTMGAPMASAVELKLADFQPANHLVVDSTYVPFAETLAEQTDGELTVQLYMGGELGPGPAEQYNRTVEGVTDIAFSLPGYTASNFPRPC